MRGAKVRGEGVRGGNVALQPASLYFKLDLFRNEGPINWSNVLAYLIQVSEGGKEY